MKRVIIVRHLKTDDNQNLRFSSGDRESNILPNQELSENMKILMNYQSENLRAIRKVHSFLNLPQKLDLIVY